jgi:FKBP12-rapamycin complex-associated protein
MIPILLLGGLMIWGRGGITIHKSIQFTKDAQQTAAKPRDCQYEAADSWTQLQKETLDGCPREAISIRSTSVVLWFSQTMKFTRTSAVMSIVGCLVGLGGRHSCNNMFMKKLVNDVHIDFSGCFGKTRRRKFLPARVTFRWATVMMKAFRACRYREAHLAIAERSPYSAKAVGQRPTQLPTVVNSEYLAELFEWIRFLCSNL